MPRVSFVAVFRFRRANEGFLPVPEDIVKGPSASRISMSTESLPDRELTRLLHIRTKRQAFRQIAQNLC